MMKFKRIFLSVLCLVLSVVMVSTLTGCSLQKIIDDRKEKKEKEESEQSVVSIIETVKKDSLSAEELSLLDNLVCAMYFANFSSPSQLSDQICIELLSSVLHHQDSLSNNYLVTPEKNETGYLVDDAMCYTLINAMFDYKMTQNPELIKDGYYHFPYADGAATPEVAGQQIELLEDGSFKILYNVQRIGIDGEVIYNNNLMVNVLLQDNQYCLFKILSILPMNG